MTILDGKKVSNDIKNEIKAEVDKMKANNRSEEHTSELQSRLHLVCRLLLEKKKIKQKVNNNG